MTTYPSLAAYTADVEKARHAYDADMAVAAGLCASCQRNKRDGRHRKCHGCRHQKAVA